MKIGIIADRLGLGTGGLETYERGLLRGLARLRTENEFVVFCSSKRRAEASLSFPHGFSIRPVCERSTWLRFAIGLSLSLRSTGVDVVHSCFVPPLVNLKKSVVTIHDLCPFVRPGYLPRSIELRLKVLLRIAIQQSKHIIAVSETTKSDIVTLFNVPPERMTVIPLGVDEQYHPWAAREPTASPDVPGIPERYILYVGRIESRKNISRLLRVYRWLREHRKIPHKLVLVGKAEPWGRSEIQRASPVIDDDVVLTGHVPYGLLPRLYRGADAFVFPSLFEGFGLPPLEAMACGTPVVASCIPSVAEVVGDAAVLIDPYDEQDLALALLRVLEDEPLRRELRERGLRRAARFSWAETARKTFRVYEDTAR